MQALALQASWEKAIAPQDRERIEDIFQETKNQDNNSIVFTSIKEAINYKKELLITVLIHNFSEKSIRFENTRIEYSDNEKLIANHTFTIPALHIPANVSMPWTFLFPKESYHSQPPFMNAKLVLGNNKYRK